MKTLIIYDSYYGNTAELVFAIESVLMQNGEVSMLRAANAINLDLSAYDLLIVGSPTRSFRPTQSVMQFINSISPRSLRNIMIATFDTRLGINYLKSKMLQFIIKTGGYAAKTMQIKLERKSGKAIVACEGFIVTDEKGPLAENEINRAILWAQLISKRANQNQSLLMDIAEKMM